MPRPKRSKIVSKAAVPATSRTVAVPPARQLDIEMSQASESSVAPVLRRATRGAAAAASVPVAKITAAQRRAMEQAQKRRDSAMSRLEAENDPISDNDGAATQTGKSARASSKSHEVELGRRGRPISSIESSLPMPNTTGNFRRRKREGSILGPRRAIERSVSVESELAQSQDITNIERDIPEVTMSAFKPRKRQGSILGRAGFGRDSSVEMDAGRDSALNTPARPGSAMGGNLGLFRRRVRQGSILGTPGGHGAGGRESFLGVMDDELDFAPEDESTPLNVAKGRTIPDAPEPSPAPAAISSSSNPRKRKISPVQNSDRSSPSPSPYLPENPQVERSPSASPSPSLSPPPISSPPHPQQPQQRRAQTPDIPSSTFAPPHSSSSINITPSPQRTRVTQRANQTTTSARTQGTRHQPRREAAAMFDDDLPSSPPSLTHSPDNRHVAAAKNGKGREKTAPAMMATAELQALLPRRRTRRPLRTDRDIFEIDSGEDEDADELSMIVPARGRRTPAPTARNKQITKLKSAAKGKATRGYGKKAVAEEESPASDKENGDGEVDEHDDSLAPISDSIEEEESSILEGKVGNELKKAKRKFMDVDKWEMEFESVTAEGSSQADAR